MKEYLLVVYKTYRNNSNIKKYYSQKSTLSWIEIFKDYNQECTLGITSQGYWIVITKDKYMLIEEFKHYLFCLIFLECPIKTITDTIILNLKDIENRFDIYNVFPFFEIVKFSFINSESDYWIQLALNWYVEFDTDIREMLKKELFNISNNLKLSQSSRQTARKFLK